MGTPVRSYCKNCNKIIYIRKTSKGYCQKCIYLFVEQYDKKGKNNPNFGKKASKETLEKQVLARLARKERTGYVNSPQQMEKMKLRRIELGSLRGEKNPMWKGGITPLNLRIRMSYQYKLWRKSVFERDNYTCQECSKIGGKLNADHIKPFAYFPLLRFELSNGRTLCVDCHKQTDTYLSKIKNYIIQ